MQLDVKIQLTFFLMIMIVMMSIQMSLQMVQIGVEVMMMKNAGEIRTI